MRKSYQWEFIGSLVQEFIIVDLRINGTLQIPMPFRLSRSIGEHSDISELVEDTDESAPGRLGKLNDRSTVVPIYRDSVRLQTAPTGGRKCSFIFNIHHNWPL